MGDLEARGRQIQVGRLVGWIVQTLRENRLV